MFCRYYSLNRIALSMPTRFNQVSNKLCMSICYHLFLPVLLSQLSWILEEKLSKMLQLRGHASKKFLKACGRAAPFPAAT